MRLHNCECIHILYKWPIESVMITTKPPWRLHACCAPTCWRIDIVRGIHLVHIKLVLQLIVKAGFIGTSLIVFSSSRGTIVITKCWGSANVIAPLGQCKLHKESVSWRLVMIALEWCVNHTTPCLYGLRYRRNLSRQTCDVYLWNALTLMIKTPSPYGRCTRSSMALKP